MIGILLTFLHKLERKTRQISHLHTILDDKYFCFQANGLRSLKSESVKLSDGH